jgi:hypothetical protein
MSELSWLLPLHRSSSFVKAGLKLVSVLPLVIGKLGIGSWDSLQLGEARSSPGDRSLPLWTLGAAISNLFTTLLCVFV